VFTDFASEFIYCWFKAHKRKVRQTSRKGTAWWPSVTLKANNPHQTMKQTTVIPAGLLIRENDTGFLFSSGILNILCTVLTWWLRWSLFSSLKTMMKVLNMNHLLMQYSMFQNEYTSHQEEYILIFTARNMIVCFTVRDKSVFRQQTL
jgi:hypothetical protein